MKVTQLTIWLLVMFLPWLGCSKKSSSDIQNDQTEQKHELVQDTSDEALNFKQAESCYLAIDYAIDRPDGLVSEKVGTVVVHVDSGNVKISKCKTMLFPSEQNQYIQVAVDNNKSVGVLKNSGDVSVKWQTWKLLDATQQTGADYVWSKLSPNLEPQSLTSALIKEYPDIFQREDDMSFISFISGRKILGKINNYILYYEANYFVDEDSDEDDEDDDFVHQETEVYKACHNLIGAVKISTNNKIMKIEEVPLNAFYQEVYGMNNMESVNIEHKNKLIEKLFEYSKLEQNDLNWYRKTLSLFILPSFERDRPVSYFTYGHDQFYSLNDIADVSTDDEETVSVATNPPCALNSYENINIPDEFISKNEKIMSHENTCGYVDVKNKTVYVDKVQISLDKIMSETALNKQNYHIVGFDWLKNKDVTNACL